MTRNHFSFFFDETVVGKSLRMLSETLESSNASRKQIEEKLAAFRKARKKPQSNWLKLRRSFGMF